MLKTIMLLVALISGDKEPATFTVLGSGSSKATCEQIKEQLQPKTDKPLSCLVLVVPETI